MNALSRNAIITSALVFLALDLTLTFPLASQEKPSGQDILKAIDANSKVKSASYEAVMSIKSGKKSLVKSMKATAAGDRALMEFTNAEDRGVKYLKLGDELWIYFPEEDDTVHVAGAELKGGLMGSDISYEDAMDPDEMAQKYQVTVEGREDIDGRPCWVLDLVAQVKGVPYDRRKLWVDAERYLALKEEMYSKSGTILKASRISAVEKKGGRWVAMAFEMRDMRKKDSLTTFELKSISFDLPVSEKLFSLEALKK